MSHLRATFSMLALAVVAVAAALLILAALLSAPSGARR